eukprot:scaffold38816_cov31-Tisochrysis_lutea.AAC.1
MILTLSPARGTPARRLGNPPVVAVSCLSNTSTQAALSHLIYPRFLSYSALIQNVCHVKNKDIRKFLDGIYVSHKGTVITD